MEAKARHSFVREENNELSMTRGQKLRVLVHGSSWSLILIGEEEGWAPTNYLEFKKIPAYVGKMTDQNIVQMLREQPEGSIVISQNAEKSNFTFHLKNPKTCKDTTSKHEILRSSQNDLVVNGQKRSTFTIFSNRSFCSINEMFREIATDMTKNSGIPIVNFDKVYRLKELNDIANFINFNTLIAKEISELILKTDCVDLTLTKPSKLFKLEAFLCKKGKTPKTKREYKDHINHWNELECDRMDFLLKHQEDNLRKEKEKEVIKDKEEEIQRKIRKEYKEKCVKNQRDLDKLDPAVVDYWFDYEKENLLKIRDREIYNLRHEAFLRQENTKLNALSILDPFTNATCDHALLLIKDLVTSTQHVELNSEENQYIFNVLLPSFLQNLYSRIFNVPYDQSLKMIQTTPLRPDDEFSIENCCIKCNKYFKTDEDLKCHQKVHENKRHMQDEQLKNKKKKD